MAQPCRIWTTASRPASESLISASFTPSITTLVPVAAGRCPADSGGTCPLRGSSNGPKRYAGRRCAGSAVTAG